MSEFKAAIFRVNFSIIMHVDKDNSKYNVYDNLRYVNYYNIIDLREDGTYNNR